MLKNGHVPPRHGVYVDRPELTKQVRTALQELKERDGWVVVHGMAGFGKTILAMEAIRDGALLREVFPGQLVVIKMYIQYELKNVNNFAVQYYLSTVPKMY